MPDLSAFSKPTQTPQVFDYRNCGTTAGTTTISSEPVVLGAIVVTRRVASGVAIIYDSAGTSGTAIGTIALGTQTFSDPPPPYDFNVRTINGLTVTNSADMGLTVSFSK